MSFDPMAAAVDWLDAYRAGDIDSIVEMYADDAVLHCDCDGETTVGGRTGLKAYWSDRLRRHPAIELHKLTPEGEGVLLSYVTALGIVDAKLTFNGEGHIAAFACKPAAQPSCGVPTATTHSTVLS